MELIQADSMLHDSHFHVFSLADATDFRSLRCIVLINSIVSITVRSPAGGADMELMKSVSRSEHIRHRGCAQYAALAYSDKFEGTDQGN